MIGSSKPSNLGSIAQDIRRAAALLGTLSLAALGGCGDGRPSDWPDPDLGWFGSGCPNLAGTYELDSAPGSSFGLDYTPLKPQLRPPRHHSRWSLERTEHTSVLRSSATETDIRTAFETWRNRETYVQSPGVTVMRRGHPLDPAIVANLFPQHAEHGQWEEISRECSGGWLIGDPPSEDHAKAAGIDIATPVHLARADDGGLIAWYEYSYEASFDVWCGDGCKGFPLGTWTKRRWAYWRPAEPPVDAKIDWAALIANDPRPVRTEEMYTAYQHPPLREVDVAEKQAAAKAKALTLLASSEDILERVRPLLPRGSQVTEVNHDAPDVVLRGYAAAMSQVSEILRALHTASDTTPELVLIELEAKARYRFELRLPPSTLTQKSR